MRSQRASRNTNMKIKPTKLTNYPLHTAICSVALCLTFAEPAQSAATATVGISVTDIGMGIFQYDLTIANTGTEDISIISINDAPLNDTIILTTLQSPPDFFASYDPGLGIIDFLEDTSTFTAGSVTTGFAFQSDTAPDTAFQDFSGFTTLGEPVTFSANAVVPEPSVAALAFAGIIGLLMRRRR